LSGIIVWAEVFVIALNRSSVPKIQLSFA
jgi:hypothetical protein